MNEILKKLVNHQKLTRAESMKAMLKVGKGEIDPFQIATFLSIYMMRSITSNELAGFRDALLKLCISVDLSDFDPIDLCGTGGDAKNTFNISTISSFVAAGAGIKVAKHGNYGVSSSCGSSNVLEFLGIKFSNKVDFLTKSIDTAGICILHAPLFHPAMKHVAPIRKSLKLKTFFNILGPLVNPCFPKKQITGVFDLSLLKLYKFLLDETANSFCVIHDLNGFDEISLTGDTKIISNFGEDIISPKIFGLDRIDANKIVGGKSISESASIFLSVLKNEATIEQKEVVCVNAGLAISTSISVSLIEGYEMAKESIESKKALNSFKSLLNLSQNDNS